jgi:hypothetical protein
MRAATRGYCCSKAYRRWEPTRPVEPVRRIMGVRI